MTNDESATFTTLVIITLVIIFIVYLVVSRGIKLVHQAEVMIIERFGGYKTMLKPGLHWIWPYIEQPRRINWRYLDAKHNAAHCDVVSITTDRVDMREHVIDFGRQHVITKDTVQIDIDALVYFRVTDPRLAVYKIQNLPDAVELLTQTTLRNIIANMTLDDTFSSREQINADLLGKIQRDAERWGVSITRVEIFNILPPRDVKNAMEKQIKAERERRSAVLKADGQREAAVIRSRGEAAKVVLSAEGQRTSTLLRAKGEAEAKMLIANAEAQCITSIKEAITEPGVRAVDYLVAVQWLNSLRNMTASSKPDKVVLIPQEITNGIEQVLNMNGFGSAAAR